MNFVTLRPDEESGITVRSSHLNEEELINLSTDFVCKFKCRWNLFQPFPILIRFSLKKVFWLFLKHINILGICSGWYYTRIVQKVSKITNSSQEQVKMTCGCSREKTETLTLGNICQVVLLQVNPVWPPWSQNISTNLKWWIHKSWKEKALFLNERLAQLKFIGRSLMRLTIALDQYPFTSNWQFFVKFLEKHLAAN